MKLVAVFLLGLFLSLNAMAQGTVLINGKNIKTREELHVTIAKGLHFSKFYGKNLDALFDILVSDVSGENIIRIKNINILRARIGAEYVQSLLETIGDASEQNPRVILLLE